MGLVFNRIIVANDHAGFRLKKDLFGIIGLDPLLSTIDWTDLGTENDISVDYPDYAQKAANAILNGTADGAILICGTGVGMSIAANRTPGIRAALGNDGPTTIRLARSHNNANILCLGQNVMGISTADDTVRAFLTTPFDGGERHVRRLMKIDGDHG